MHESWLDRNLILVASNIVFDLRIGNPEGQDSSLEGPSEAPQGLNESTKPFKWGPLAPDGPREHQNGRLEGPRGRPEGPSETPEGPIEAPEGPKSVLCGSQQIQNPKGRAEKVPNTKSPNRTIDQIRNLKKV